MVKLMIGDILVHVLVIYFIVLGHMLGYLMSICESAIFLQSISINLASQDLFCYDKMIAVTNEYIY